MQVNIKLFSEKRQGCLLELGPLLELIQCEVSVVFQLLYLFIL